MEGALPPIIREPWGSAMSELEWPSGLWEMGEVAPSCKVSLDGEGPSSMLALKAEFSRRGAWASAVLLESCPASVLVPREGKEHQCVKKMLLLFAA